MTRPTWIFQASPERYDIQQSLKVENTEYWNCMQHASRIRKGDQVLIWICGKDAGIYAVGTALSDPVERPDSLQGMCYWKDKSQGKAVRPRVLVQYERVLLERPLTKDYLRWDPAFSALSVLQQPRGTNFKVNEAEWQAMSKWLDMSEA